MEMMPVEEEEDNFDDAAQVVYMRKKNSVPNKRQPINSESTPSKVTLKSYDQKPRTKREKYSIPTINDSKAKHDSPKRNRAANRRKRTSKSPSSQQSYEADLQTPG